MKEQNNRSEFTIGLDLGERRHRFCALNGKGEVVEEGTLGNDRVSLGRWSARYRGALAVIEAGAHSPWISRYLERLGWEVIVSNPRKVRAIYQHERKSDRRDALMLARIGRMDRALLYPVRHGSEEAQQDLLRIKLGDSLVRARVALINSVRFSLKSLGYAVSNPSSERFHKVAMESLPEAVREMIAPSVQALAELSARIAVLEREISLLARTKYPQTLWLQQVPGVGAITALYFVWKMEDPKRFKNVRAVGAYTGLCPRRDQSGASDPQLRISKRGDGYLRRLLVSAAQYILGPFGPQSALREYGIEVGGRWHEAGSRCRSPQTLRSLAELVEEPNAYQPYPALRQTTEDKRIRERCSQPPTVGPSSEDIRNSGRFGSKQLSKDGAISGT
jgi:transposase